MSDTHVNAYIAEAHEKRQQVARAIAEAEALEAKVRELGGTVATDKPTEESTETGETKSGLFSKKSIPSN